MRWQQDELKNDKNDLLLNIKDHLREVEANEKEIVHLAEENIAVDPVTEYLSLQLNEFRDKAEVEDEVVEAVPILVMIS